MAPSNIQTKWIVLLSIPAYIMRWLQIQGFKGLDERLQKVFITCIKAKGYKFCVEWRTGYRASKCSSEKKTTKTFIWKEAIYEKYGIAE